MFGVKGWVKVYSYTQPREAILDYRHWYLQKNEAWREVEVAEGKKHGKGIIVRLAGLNDRDQAAAMVECDVAVERESLPAAGKGSFYWTDLEGLEIRHRDGTDLGSVAYLLETGANDVLVVKQGRIERLIPFVQGQFVTDIDLDNGEMTVDWDPDF